MRLGNFNPLESARERIINPKKLIDDIIQGTPPVAPVGGVVKGGIKFGIPFLAGAIGGTIGGLLLGGGKGQEQTQTAAQETQAEQTQVVGTRQNTFQFSPTTHIDRSITRQYTRYTITGSPYASIQGSPVISPYDIVTGATQDTPLGVGLSQGVSPMQGQGQTAKSTDMSGLLLIGAAIGGIYLLTKKQ